LIRQSYLAFSFWSRAEYIVYCMIKFGLLHRDVGEETVPRRDMPCLGEW